MKKNAPVTSQGRTGLEIVLIAMIVGLLVSCFIYFSFFEDVGTNSNPTPQPHSPSIPRPSFTQSVWNYFVPTPKAETNPSPYLRGEKIAAHPAPFVLDRPSSPAMAPEVDGKVVGPPSGPEAVVSVGDSQVHLKPDSIGNYPRVTVDPSNPIPITLKLDPHEAVEVQTLDGGVIDEKYSSIEGSSDPSGNLQLDFQTSAGPGAYRVTVMRGGGRSVLNFWVGPPLPARVTSASP